MAGLDARAAVELAEQVADVHVDGALADEELLGDLAVGAADGYVAQDLELAPGQLDAVGRRRRRGCRAAARPTRRARDLFRRLGGERARTELGRAAVGVAEPLERLLALVGGGEGDPGAQFDLRPLVRDGELRCSSTARERLSAAAVGVAFEQGQLADRLGEGRDGVVVAAVGGHLSQRRGAELGFRRGRLRANQLAAQRMPQTA